MNDLLDYEPREKTIVHRSRTNTVLGTIAILLGPALSMLAMVVAQFTSPAFPLVGVVMMLAVAATVFSPLAAFGFLIADYGGGPWWLWLLCGLPWFYAAGLVVCFVIFR